MTRRGPSTTLARLERILVMVPWLLEHEGVSVDEVAERFGVAPRDVIEDLDVLGYCGLPGYGGGDLIEASVVGDRVSVRMADYFRRPLRLSLREALTLLLAARALAAVEGLPESAGLRTAGAKLEEALGAEVDPAVALDLRVPGEEHLSALRDAVARRRLVELVYRSGSKAETTVRRIEPWAVVGALGAWYLQGHDLGVDAVRDFRLDRIHSLHVTDEPATRAPRDPEPPVYTPRPEDQEVVLDLEPESWWVAEWVAEPRVEGDGRTRTVTFRTPTLTWVARLLLRLGPGARVVAPEELAALVRAVAGQTLGAYAARSASEAASNSPETPPAG